MESTGKFESLFLKMLQEEGDGGGMTAGAGGVFGDGPTMHTIYGPNAAAQNISSGDTYEPGDAKIYKPLGKVQTRKGTTGGKKGKKRNNKKNKGVNFATGEENEESTHPGYEDTTWSDGEITITMRDVEDKLTELQSPVISIPVKDITHLDIHTRHKPNKTPEQVKSTYDRAMRADLKYPIIITKNNGKYDMILDGNHRLHKAVEIGEDTIQAKVLDLSKVPEEWLSVFG